MDENEDYWELNEVIMLMGTVGGWKVEVWNVETLDSMTIHTGTKEDCMEVQEFIKESVQSFIDQ